MFLLVSWRSVTKNLSRKDFLFIYDLGITNECIKEISARESIRYANRPKFKRHGAANGFHLPTSDTDCRTLSMCKATQDDLRRAYIRPLNGHSTAAYLAWHNIATSNKTGHSMYVDSFGTKWDNSKSHKELPLGCEYEMQYALRQMEGRLKCLLITDVLGLEEPGEVWKCFRVALDEVNFEAWPRQSMWHAVLLEWACRMVEMRNHKECVLTWTKMVGTSWRTCLSLAW